MKAFITLLILSCFAPSLQACFILVLRDGQNVLVANHEDWFSRDAQVRILPGGAERYGSVIFTFASEGWAQGGMNEKGLFFDGAFTPLDPIEFDVSLQKPEGHIWQTVLDKCATVEEALDLLKQYKLTELEEVHMVLADATGRSVIIGTDAGKIVVHETEEPHQLQTNFNLANPELGDEPKCRRFETANSMLLQNGAVTFANAEQILASTHQDKLTIYSNIYDLKNQIVRVYQNADFTAYQDIDLRQAMQQGYQQLMIEDLIAGEPFDPNKRYSMLGKVIDLATEKPVPFANIGIPQKAFGTLSDEDGSFELYFRQDILEDSVTISALGYEPIKRAVRDLLQFRNAEHPLLQKAIQLREVEVVGEKSKLNKKRRWGWMMGKHGVLPVDSTQGGAAVANYVQAPEGVEGFFLDEVWFRVLYSTKGTFFFRLRIYEVDSIDGSPGKEIWDKNVLLEGSRRIGWERIDVRNHDIYLTQKEFYLALEWITSKKERSNVITALSDWDSWKAEQFAAGNPKARQVTAEVDGKGVDSYKYKGSMTDWPGFDDLPSLTALVVDDRHHQRNAQFKSYIRNQSLDKWKPMGSILNMIVKMRY